MRCAERYKAVDDCFHFRNVVDMRPRDKAIFTGYAVTRHNLRCLPDCFNHVLHLAWQGSCPDQECQAIAKLGRVDARAVSGDDANILKTPDPVRHTGGG